MRRSGGIDSSSSSESVQSSAWYSGTRQLTDLSKEYDTYEAWDRPPVLDEGNHPK